MDKGKCFEKICLSFNACNKASGSRKYFYRYGISKAENFNKVYHKGILASASLLIKKSPQKEGCGDAEMVMRLRIRSGIP